MFVEGGIVVLLIIGLIVFAVSRTIQKVAAPKQPVELAHAARLLDQVVATDEAVPTLPTKLRHEVDAWLKTYYREIEA